MGPATVYVTDLSHPHVDPDDHIDLAVAHGLDLDVRAIVLGHHSGAVPVSQLNAITGRSWQVDSQGAAAGILRALQASERVVVVIAGSCQDVAAAYDTDPGLFHDKAERLVVFAGDASAAGYVEYNVGLDPLAFLRLMGSGLPIRWVPCFDGGPWQAGTRSSFVRAEQAELFPADLPAPVLRYFSYMAHKATGDPIAYLSQPVTEEDRRLLSSGLRNLWVGPLVGLARGDGSVRWQGATVAVFEPVTVRFARSGALDPAGPFEARVDRWRVLDTVGWRQAMVAGTVKAFRRIPLTLQLSLSSLGGTP